jgi:hypothetical protein
LQSFVFIHCCALPACIGGLRSLVTASHLQTVCACRAECPPTTFECSPPGLPTMICLRYFHQLVLLSHRALDNSALRVTVCFTASRLLLGIALTGVRPRGFLAAPGLPSTLQWRIAAPLLSPLPRSFIVILCSGFPLSVTRCGYAQCVTRGPDAVVSRTSLAFG